MMSTRSVKKPMAMPVSCMKTTSRFIQGVSHGESAPYPVVVIVSTTVWNDRKMEWGSPSRVRIPQL
jgi:hypothetical protein